MMTWIWVNIVSGNGLLHDGTKPLTEPTLTNHQGCLVLITFGWFHKRYLIHQLLKFDWKLPKNYSESKILFRSARGQYVNLWTAGNTQMHTQHCSYWCPGAKTPGHQYPPCWWNIHYIVSVSFRNITTRMDNIRKWNYILNKMAQLLG